MIKLMINISFTKDYNSKGLIQKVCVLFRLSFPFYVCFSLQLPLKREHVVKSAKYSCNATFIQDILFVVLRCFFLTSCANTPYFLLIFICVQHLASEIGIRDHQLVGWFVEVVPSGLEIGSMVGTCRHSDAIISNQKSRGGQNE